MKLRLITVPYFRKYTPTYEGKPFLAKFLSRNWETRRRISFLSFFMRGKDLLEKENALTVFLLFPIF